MRKFGFWLILISLPLLLIAALEGAVRLLGLVPTYPVFVPHPAAPNYLTMRPDVIRRYFPAGAEIPNVTVEPHYFLKDKPKNGIRIFVQGGSTAAGYPYGLGASIASMLENRLRHSWPDKPVEVVNTALSAVNSYTLLDVADDIIAQQPDAVLIYAGHNEFVGIMGVGSNYRLAESPAATAVYLQLKQLHLYKLLEQVLVSKPAVAANTQEKRTLMSKMAAAQPIALDSPVYQAGMVQFQRNMSELLSKYREAGIPVYLATVGSNIADQPPFQSADLTPEQLKSLTALQRGDSSQFALLAAEAKTQQQAMLSYQLGQWLRQQQRGAEAQEWLSLARDFDTLRFRAPQEINRQIKGFVDNKTVWLVDAEQALRDHSPDGLIGRQLMLEHLHPNLPGYFVIADAFYQALAKSKQLPAYAVTVEKAKAWALRPVVPAEEFAAFARVAQLTSDYPFQRTPQPIALPAAENPLQQAGLDFYAKKIDWLQLMQISMQVYQQQGDRDMQLKIALILADAAPDQPTWNAYAAKLLEKSSYPQLAWWYWQRAARQDPNNKSYQTAN
jgi:lysophospholipase L1-like esterase